MIEDNDNSPLVERRGFSKISLYCSDFDLISEAAVPVTIRRTLQTSDSITTFKRPIPGVVPKGFESSVKSCVSFHQFRDTVHHATTSEFARFPQTFMQEHLARILTFTNIQGID